MESDDDSPNELDSIFYYDIGTIIRYSQEGRGYGRPSKRKQPEYAQTAQLLQTLYELGWRTDYLATTFPHMHDDLLSNWPDTLLIKNIFSKKIRQQDHRHTIKDSLQRIGLHDSVATKLAAILEPLQDTSYTHAQLLDIAIEYILGDYEPITPPDTTHLFSPEIVNRWQTVNVIRDDVSKACIIYNIPYHCHTMRGLEQCTKALQALSNPDSPATYYFHATSWDGSTSILHHVDHQKGRPCLDFGIHPGFYMSPDIMRGVEWCKKNKRRWSNETAIVIFKVPNQLPTHLQRKNLEGAEWSEVTKEARRCKRKDEINLIRDYDFVYGNMVSNPRGVKYEGEQPVHHDPPKKQLVSRTSTADRLLNASLIGCLYFQKR
jgi:hypothetical protein